MDKKTRAILSVVKVGGTIGQPVWQAEMGMTDVPNELECLSIQARRGVPITFTEEDMLIGLFCAKPVLMIHFPILHVIYLLNVEDLHRKEYTVRKHLQGSEGQ